MKPPPLGRAAAIAIFAATVAGVSALAFLTWPQTTASLDNDIRTADDVKRADPEFAAWFAALPKVAPSGLLRDGNTVEERTQYRAVRARAPTPLGVCEYSSVSDPSIAGCLIVYHDGSLHAAACTLFPTISLS